MGSRDRDSFGAIGVQGIDTIVSPFADATHAVTMLFVYVVGFTVVSALVLKTRDVTS